MSHRPPRRPVRDPEAVHRDALLLRLDLHAGLDDAARERATALPVEDLEAVVRPLRGPRAPRVRVSLLDRHLLRMAR